MRNRAYQKGFTRLLLFINLFCDTFVLKHYRAILLSDKRIIILLEGAGMKFLAELPVWCLVGSAILLTGGALWLFYQVKIRTLLIPILRVLHERGTTDLVGVIKALREMEIYPPHTPMFFIKDACRSAVKKKLIMLGQNMFIPRFTILNKGCDVLDQNDWRTGRKKFPA